MQKKRSVAAIGRMAALFAALLTGAVAAAVGSGDVKDPMMLDPVLSAPPPVLRFHPRIKQLMIAALARPDVDTRRRAADTIGRLARDGMPGLDDLVEPLEAMLNSSAGRPRLRLAAARALVRLDARSAAASLHEHAVLDGLDMILLVDPALASWHNESAPDEALQWWMARLNDAQASRAARVSAIESLATVRHAPAVPHLRRLALDSMLDASLRLAAGRALGRMVTEGLDSLAETLLGRGSLPDRVVATTIIAGHEDEMAVALMRRMATDREPAVAYAALRRLVALDPMLVRDMVEHIHVPVDVADHRRGNVSNLRSLADDPKIRRIAAQVLVHEATPESVNLLRPMLDDPHPDVRVYVRRSLVNLDHQNKLKAAIRHIGVAALSGDEVDQWRGVEQAALLLGAIDHEQAAPALLDLMVAARPEVRVAAVIGLRRLAIPETLPQVLAMAELISKGLEDVFALRSETSIVNNAKAAPILQDAVKSIGKYDLDRQVGHMMQMFGQMRYRPAEPLMRRHIPKDSFGTQARSGAVWSLGLFHAGSGDRELAETLSERLSDVDPFNPERPLVRRFSAIALGRIKLPEFNEVLSDFLEAEYHVVHVGGACRWALIQIEGKDRPPLRPADRYAQGFFLEPVDALDREEYLVSEP